MGNKWTSMNTNTVLLSPELTIWYYQTILTPVPKLNPGQLVAVHSFEKRVNKCALPV